jgi:hypothetical protein
MLGQDARLMPAKYLRSYSKGQKNDFRDAEAIAEAVQRPTMKFVATKTADSLTFRRCTASASDWSVSVPASSIRSVRSRWSGHRRAARPAFPAVRVAGYPRDAHRCALASHVAHHRESGGRLAPAG